MGEIFLARLEGAEGFEKLYVVKRILPHLADDARFRQMLIGEARIASKMAHANICQVYELGETDGQLYIVMEYLEGITMLPLLRRASKLGQPLEFGFVGGVVQQVTDALHYAHELRDRTGDNLGIIHRDVSPGNVFLTESGVAKVLDFGIAKAKGASAKTEDGAVKGKYAYMAPEQLRGAEIDRRVDLFALGVVVYEMLALRRLFQRKTDYLTFRAVMEQPISDVRRYRPDAPEALAQVLARALDREPEGRFDSARQFGTAVSDALAPYGRPWTQGEISDFVRAHFAEEIAKRSHQVASALQRTQVGVASQRATMPLISHPEDEHTAIDDDDDFFPPVETDVQPTPEFAPQPAPSRAGQSGDFVGGTPPPFGGETTGSAPSLQPLRIPPGQSTPPHNVVVVRQRSLLWPVVAIAGVAVAAGALYLVWQQTQQQQQPAVVNITSAPTQPQPIVAPDPPPDPGSDATEAPDKDKVPGVRPHVKKNPPVDPSHAYDVVFESKQKMMLQCFIDHPEPVPSAGIQLDVLIASNGRAKSVAIHPDELNSGGLAGCIRGVLMAASFPQAKSDFHVTVPLRPRKTT